MPEYKYICNNQTCSYTFTEKQPITSRPITLCPMCGEHTERIIFAPMLDFRGSDWTSPGF